MLILLAGGFLRLTGLAWDEGQHLHPDERFSSMVEEKLTFPGWGAYFDSARSTLNPYNRGHESYVYGTLPLFLAKAAGKLVGRSGYDGAYLVGRALSGIFDLVSVWAAYLLTRRFGGRRTALVAAAFLAFAPLGIQLSHFWGSDTFLTTFSVLTLLGATRIAMGKRDLAGAAATGVALGLAVACKITALALLGPVGIAALIGAGRQLAGPGPNGRSRRVLLREALQLLILGVAAAVTVRVALPYAFLGPSPLSFRPDPRWIADLKRLSALTHSVAGFPPMLQWAGRSIFFPLRNFVLWGAGPFFGLAALGGVFWGLWRVARRRWLALAPLLFHAVFLFGYHGLSLTKTIRYFYPAYPVLAVLGALAASAAADRARQRTGPARAVRFLPLFLAAGTLLCGFAFSSIYRRPNTRIAASRWIYENVPPPARFANEHWDDPVPLRLPDHDSAPYGGPSLPLYNPDSARKVSELVTELQKADWVAITSNRLYGSITRVPDVFPMSAAYYRALFDGRLGFERVAEFTSYPSLGPLVIPDDAAEETFTVYDHPRVLLFRKTPAFSLQRARSILAGAMREEPPIMNVWETWPRAKRRVSAPIVPPRQPELAARTPRPELPIGSAGAALVFYFALLLVAALAWPAAYALFPRFGDRGAGLARLLGLLFSTWVLVLAVQMGWIAKGRPAALLSLALVGAVSLAILIGRRREIAAFLRERWRLVLAGEIAFAAGFLLFTLLRAFNPEIYWGEKPMDFSILNILVRTSTLPASDPWLAGVPLGYYTFGQEMVATLSLWTGLSTRYTFNLAFGLLGGLIAQGAFALGRNWAGRAAGIAAAFFVGIFGNLSGLRLWLIDHRPLDWHYFWATSRVVEHTINEYPFWSLLFADLHAHVFAVPLLLFVLACALHLVRSDRAAGFLVSAALLGFAVAIQALTNAWDVPLLAGLLLLVFLIAALREGRPSARSATLAALGLPVALAAAAATAAPLWVRRGGAPAIDWNREPGALGRDVLTVFGLFFLLGFGWWLAAALRRLSASGLGRLRRWLSGTLLVGVLVLIGLLSPEMLCAAGILFFLVAALRMADSAEERLACGIVATGFFLILFTQRVFIWDRMNTFFKLYYEAWILLAVATAVLVFRPESEGSLRRWVWPARAAVALLAVASLFTTVTAARGALDRFSSPSAQERPAPGAKPRRYLPAGGPTLDGLRYLRQLRPGEYRAVLWLRTAVRGTPVVLEAQGPSYQDFGRISMLTGMPTVLGWDYHVKQRGNPEEEIEARKEAVRHIYSAPTAKEVEGLLRRYHVGYVYVGWLERKTYPSAGLRKFAETPELFQLVYENPEVRIYRVVGGETQDVLLPRREKLPAQAGRVEEVEEPPEIRETAEPDRPPFSGMNQPRDAAADERGRIWIADFGNSRLRVFDREGGFLGGWGGRGSGPHGFNELCAVAIRGEDLYVADTWNGRVQAYSLSGEFRMSAIGLYGPRGVAVDGRGRVWVTDSGNHRIVVYDRELVQMHVFGKRGSERGEFIGPVGIAAGPRGLIYVADTGNRRIQVLDSGGLVQAVWPVPGWGDGVEPHVEADGAGTVWVSDPARNAVFEFGRDGDLRRRHDADAAGTVFVRPTGLALDEKTRILYVVNSGNNTVSRLSVPEGKKR